MHRAIRLSLGAAACILAFACSSDTQSPTAEAPTYAVSDGAHNGNPDFFFLPPLFKNPVNSPNYEPNAANLTLKPTVEICELGAADASGARECIATVKQFPASALTIADQSYQVNWKTDETPLNVSKFYRIRVLVGASLLGFADVDPVSSARDLKNVQTNEYIPLQDGRTLPIKFRIESGALCVVDGSPCASETVNLNQGGEIELFGAGEDFKVVIPPGTSATFGGQTITEVTFNLEICDGIDVDLPLYGPCLRISTYFNGTGSNELEFISNKLRISLCVLNEQYHTPDETRQEGLITLHQQDGTLIRALPHIEPDCGGVIGTSGWQWLRSLAARLLVPKSAFAASRTALLHIGAGGETGTLGAKCTPPPPSSARRPDIMMTTVCPPSSPTVGGAAAGPQRAATATVTPPMTVSDFQFALPAKMDYVNPADAQRTAPPGTDLPTAVKVTDWDGTAVQGARVTFVEPAFEGPGEDTVGVAISDDQGIAQIQWTIGEGFNHVVATGRGIAARNNYPNPDELVKPFMPDISLPIEEQEPVALGTGRVPFFATGQTVVLMFREITAGGALTCAGNSGDSTAYCAGVNGQFAPYGTMGTFGPLETCGLFPCSTSPIQISRTAKFSQLSAGANHICGLNAYDLSVMCWGRGNHGQLGNGSTDSSAVPVAVVGEGFNAVTSGGLFDGHSCAVNGGGSISCWGDNAFGQLGNGTTANSSVPVPISAPVGVTFSPGMSAGSRHTCAISADMDLYCWGGSTHGELGNGTNAASTTPVLVAGEHKWAFVSSGHEHTCAIEWAPPSGYGATYCWGRNDAGQLGNGSTTDANTPALVSGEHSFFMLGVGGFHSCGLDFSGQVFCWGGNANGELGTGSFTGSSTCEVSGTNQGCELTPVPVSGDHNFAWLESHGSADHVCALSYETDLPVAYCWGLNNVGQLGIGVTGNRATPTRVAKQ